MSQPNFAKWSFSANFFAAAAAAAAALACDVTGCWLASGGAFQAKIGGIGT
jgi:hypothetical protein